MFEAKHVLCAVSAAVLSFGMMSCNKDVDSPVPSGVDDALIEVNVGLVDPSGAVVRSGMGTRAGLNATEQEKGVDAAKTYILVYRGDELVNSAMGVTATFNLAPGQYDFVAVANSDSDLSAASLDDVKSEDIDFSAEKLGSFSMAGRVTSTLSSAGVGINIKLKRLVAKFVVSSVSREMTGDAAGKDFTIDKIYVVNAAGKAQRQFIPSDVFFGVLPSYSSYSWVNPMWCVETAASLTCALPARRIENNETYDSDVVLYAYPNQEGTDAHYQTSASVHENTRVVLECTFGGEKCYYPATLGKVEANKLYTITYKLSRKGLDDTNPDNPDPGKGPDGEWKDDVSASVTVTVGDWDDGGVLNFGE